MTAWGGHRNGRIPTSELEYVGIGVRSGEPQYLHPAVAEAWRALQADFKRRKVDLLITEGYRTFELQQAYWNRYQSGGTVAARPGTSNHGWGTAVDMANYFALPPSVRRPLIEARGFSLATGDRVREPWHIEYVGSLQWAATPGTPVNPGTEDDMSKPRIIQAFGLPDTAVIGGGMAYLFPNAAELAHVRNMERPTNPGIDGTQTVGDAGMSEASRRELLNTIVNIYASAQGVQNSIAAVRADIAGIETGGATVDTGRVLEALAAVPTATVNELRDRL